ncbi:MAG: hypothetical protein QMD80_05505 [archaeon]|nr:hypothetical protein [archaeon]
MKIEKITTKPYEKSIFPSISFEVEISYKKYKEAIIGLNGWLEADDGKIIAEVEEVAESIEPGYIAARKSSFDHQFKEEIRKATVVSFLEKRALEHIEERRKADRIGDLKLTLRLKVKYVINMAVVSPSYPVRPEVIGLPEIPIQTSDGKGRGEIVIYASDSKFSTDYANRWLLSGDGNPIFLSIGEEILTEDIKIPSGNWVHDYAPKLGLGEYFVVAIPKGEKRILEAWNYIEKAEECFRRWDTKGVYANCREVGYLLERIVKDKFGKDDFNYKERWGSIYGRFEHLASIDLHLEELKQRPQYVSEDVKIGREDVEHILNVTKLLIKYAEELTREGE